MPLATGFVHDAQPLNSPINSKHSAKQAFGRVYACDQAFVSEEVAFMEDRL